MYLGTRFDIFVIVGCVPSNFEGILDSTISQCVQRGRQSLGPCWNSWNYFFSILSATLFYLCGLTPKYANFTIFANVYLTFGKQEILIRINVKV